RWYTLGMKLPRRASLWEIFSHSVPIRAGFGAVLLLSLFAWAPATYPGYWQAQEGFIPVFNITQTNSLANVGVTPDLWRGMGQATFLLSRPFLLLGVSPTTTVRLGFILYSILGTLGCYSWLRLRLGDRAAGLAGVIYLFAPLLLATIYLRGSLSDMAVVALLPMALAGLTSYAQTRSLSAAGIAVLALLWIWQAQAGLALICTIVLFTYALLVERSGLTALIVGASAMAGMTSLAGVWHVRAESFVPFAEHFVYPYQLFHQDWQFPHSIAGPNDRFPYQLSIIALLYTVLYGLVRFTPSLLHESAPYQSESDIQIRRLWLFGCTINVLLIALTLPWSNPLWQWSHADQLLTYPWQILLITLPFWAATAGALPTTHQLFRKTPLWVVLLAMVVLSSSPYLDAEYTEVDVPATPIAFIGSNANVAVLRAGLTEKRQPRAAELTIIWQTLQPLSFDYNIFFQALRIDEESTQADKQTERRPLPIEQTLSVIAQLDSQPLRDGPAATAWQPGQIFTATYQLDLSQLDDAVRGEEAHLLYYFGYYDWRDGQRLPVNQGVDDKLIIYGP
ncbi:MAG: hypothetical protein KDE31_18275, partial [Caldilineaceae bacterium]|nr:hypothetical protein [Caldilineaceae bacterium]